MHLVTYLEFLQRSEQRLAQSYRVVSDGHAGDSDVHYVTARFARECDTAADALTPVRDRMQPASETKPERLHVDGLSEPRRGPIGLLRDLQDLYQLANLVDITWTLVRQAAQGARDRELFAIADQRAEQTDAQLAWLRMRMKTAAPQTLLVAP